MPHVLVLTQPGDLHADAVIERLIQRQARYTIFDPGDFPSNAAMSVSYDRSGLIGRTLLGSGRPLDLNAVDSIWCRRPSPTTPAPEIEDPIAQECVRDEGGTFSAYIWDSLDCLSVPGKMRSIRHASCKPEQLSRAGALGLEIPPTLVTTDPEEFLDFWDHHDGQIITKPLDNPSLGVGGRSFVRFSEVPTTMDLASADAIRFCPVITQAYVPKLVELRVTVVGDRAFAVEIDSQRSNHARGDWRKYDSTQGLYAVHSLPDEIAERCVRLVTEFDLNYGALDLIFTPDGRYVFLEINPGGQWLWLEEATGIPIADAVADLLVSSDERFSRSSTNGAFR
ncbi:ATP-dependent carboxylate-amine ligase [Rhodococcus sp. HNM0563]|uniref:MvdC/MvdD family ATP grasp protein n=1 Tax=Rhodococcus sp. HNM0563 TaxID=2716339 RepID=UPI00146E20BC|nr:ATP-dependent carboxylate-amine ligase [Rhodococcus sp. HNM0563]NLU63732.1 ATP-dependent carboxylate-amine ligase [Rhodococcus sp. HNM0563]